MLTITYYHTLYRQTVVDKNIGDIEIKDGYAIFACGGTMQAVELKYIKKISEEEI